MIQNSPETLLKLAKDKELQNNRLFHMCKSNLLFGLIIFIVAIFLSSYLTGESLNISFQRGGSLLVAIYIIAEIKLINISNNNKILFSEIFNPISVLSQTEDSMKSSLKIYNKMKKHYAILQFISTLYLFTGTIIWGYGDLFFIIT